MGQLNGPVLVTGASGFIGSALTERLLELDAQVHCMLLPDDPAVNLQQVRKRIQIHRADLVDLESLERIVREVRPETVLHLAAIGVTDVHVDLALAVRVNVEGTLNLLRALDGAYKVFINTGTCHEYGSNEPPFRETQDPRPELPYAITKTAVWHFCQRLYNTKQWPIVTVRPFSVYGPRQAANTFVPACVRAALQGDEFKMTGGEQQRDMVFVSDIIEGFVRAATVPEAIGGTFNLCTGQSVALYEVAEAIFGQAGDPQHIQRGALPYREGEIWHLVGDNTRARTILGWQPQVTLQDGLEQTIQAMADTV